MSKYYLLQVLCVAGLISFFAPDCEAQKDSVNLTPVREYYGTDASLLNGKLYQNIYYRDEGTAFLFDQICDTSFLRMNDQIYLNQRLRYNVYEQNVLVYDGKDKSSLAYMPPLALVSEFSIHHSLFRKYRFADEVPAFYEVVFDGDVQCLYQWSKTRDQTGASAKVQGYGFSDKERKSYLLINDELLRYRSRGSFVKHFPKAHRKAIVSYIKEHDIDVSYSANYEISSLMTFCEYLIQSDVMKTSGIIKEQDE